MTILVTGGTGMVGRNLVGALRKSDYTVLSPNRSEMNLFSFEHTFSYVKKHNPNFIIHCAGRVGGIQANIKNPTAFLVENVDINRNLIMAAKEAGVKKLINLASSCIYPREGKNPLTEDLILTGELEPTNEGYALGKIFALRLCQYIHKEAPEFQYKTLIPCNLYGPYDKFDPLHSHLLPAIIQKMDKAVNNDDKTVEIWGDGKARREFMYVGDLVDCIQHGIKKFDTLPDLMNVGLGHDFSVLEYYQAVSEVIGYSGQFTFDLSKPTGMKQKLVSTQIAEDWGWKSRYSLKEGIDLTLKYYHELKRT